jgi:predicted nucleic acid-binding protein
MIVVADTSPVNYLVLIDAIEILPQLFGQVLIPQAVLHELQNLATPPKVRAWIEQPPAWIRVEKSVANFADAGLDKLGAGEREAIALATHNPHSLLLVDESKARQEAERLHIRFIGTLGILDRAAGTGLVDLPAVIERLLQTTFYVTPNLLKTLLENDARRRRI